MHEGAAHHCGLCRAMAVLGGDDAARRPSVSNEAANPLLLFLRLLLRLVIAWRVSRQGRPEAEAKALPDGYERHTRR